MKDDRVLILDKYDHGEVLSIINDKRNELIGKKEDTREINELFEKVVNAPTKKKSKLRRERSACER